MPSRILTQFKRRLIMELTKTFDGLSKIIRLILLIVFGVLVSGIYRIVKYFETRNVVTLVVGLIGTFTGIGNLALWLIDVVTTILNDKITFLAD